VEAISVGSAVVNDYVIWAKHIRNDPQVVHRILAMRAGETIDLVVDGIPGTWAKMADGPRGEPTPGLKPLGQMKRVWGSLFRDRKDATVEVKIMEAGTAAGAGSMLIEPPLARSPEERAAAWRAFVELSKQGWTSTGPYGPRDDLYDR
jgi:hypothetical protein